MVEEKKSLCTRLEEMVASADDCIIRDPTLRGSCGLLRLIHVAKEVWMLVSSLNNDMDLRQVSSTVSSFMLCRRINISLR